MTRRHRRARPYPANHQLVLDALEQASAPLSAYDLLGVLRDQGIAAPPTVYRALRRLTEEGRVHRIESLNAYVVCTGKHDHHQSAGFAICDSCGRVAEFPCDGIQAPVDAWAQETAFEITGITLELHGCCAACAKEAAGEGARA